MAWSIAGLVNGEQNCVFILSPIILYLSFAVNIYLLRIVRYSIFRRNMYQVRTTVLCGIVIDHIIKCQLFSGKVHSTAHSHQLVALIFNNNNFMFHHLNLDAGDRFALPMHLAYETGVVTTLPA